MNPVGVQAAAMAEAGSAAMAIVPMKADAEARLISRLLVMEMDIGSSDWTGADWDE